jgi:hypothetical protein
MLKASLKRKQVFFSSKLLLIVRISFTVAGKCLTDDFFILIGDSSVKDRGLSSGKQRSERNKYVTKDNRAVVKGDILKMRLIGNIKIRCFVEAEIVKRPN